MIRVRDAVDKDRPERLRMRRALRSDCPDDEQGREIDEEAHGALGFQETTRLVLFKKELRELPQRPRRAAAGS